MSERIGNLGYLGLIKETTRGVPLTPTDYVPFYEETMSTMGNFVKQQPAAGTNYATYNVLQGQRSHRGDFTVLAEPNTAARFFDMLLTRSSTQVVYTFTITSGAASAGATYTNNSQTFTVLATVAASTTVVAMGTGAPAASGTLTKASGTGDATLTFSANSAGASAHLFGLSTSTAPKSYTIDVSTGNVVSRYFGVEASKINPELNENEVRLKISTSALGSFQGREISTVTGSGPYTVTLKTDYDPSPTTGLVVGDLIRFFDLSAGTTIDATVATIVDGTTFTTSTNPTAIASGDFVHLRPATPSTNLLPSFLVAKNQWFFSTTAAAALALTSTSQTRVEKDSTWELMNNFESDDGAMRTGAFDPAALVRALADSSLNIKKYFDTPTDIISFNNMAKNAAVLRYYSGSTNQYQMILTWNHIKIDGKVVPDIKAGDVQYAEVEAATQFDSTDSQAFSVVIINSLTSI